MSWLFSWFSDILNYLGKFCFFFQVLYLDGILIYYLLFLGLTKKSGKLVFLGLDNAGKTTLLHMLKDDRIAQHVPTLHPSKFSFLFPSFTFLNFAFLPTIF